MREPSCMGGVPVLMAFGPGSGPVKEGHLVGSRRPLFVSIAAACMIVVSALPSSATESGSDSDLVDRYTQVVYELDSPSRSMNVLERVVDATGRVLETTRVVKAIADRPIIPLNAAPFACLNDREREGFERHPHKELLDRRKNEFVHFVYFPYSQRRAQIVGRQPTQQWLVCSTGGVDAQNGSRISLSGPVVAYMNEHATHKIGQVWREGKTPADHTVTLGFQVARGPVQVNGSIQQTPSEKLKGSPLAPFHDNRFSRNQAAGWWEHSCRPVCRRWNGSADFQGSVAEALFEFPEAMSINPNDFYYSASMENFCSNPFGCRG